MEASASADWLLMPCTLTALPVSTRIQASHCHSSCPLLAFSYSSALVNPRHPSCIIASSLSTSSRPATIPPACLRLCSIWDLAPLKTTVHFSLISCSPLCHLLLAYASSFGSHLLPSLATITRLSIVLLFLRPVVSPLVTAA